MCLALALARRAQKKQRKKPRKKQRKWSNRRSRDEGEEREAGEAMTTATRSSSSSSISSQHQQQRRLKEMSKTMRTVEWVWQTFPRCALADQRKRRRQSSNKVNDKLAPSRFNQISSLFHQEKKYKKKKPKASCDLASFFHHFHISLPFLHLSLDFVFFFLPKLLSCLFFLNIFFIPFLGSPFVSWQIHAFGANSAWLLALVYTWLER